MKQKSFFDIHFGYSGRYPLVARRLELGVLQVGYLPILPVCWEQRNDQGN